MGTHCSTLGNSIRLCFAGSYDRIRLYPIEVFEMTNDTNKNKPLELEPYLSKKPYISQIDDRDSFYSLSLDEYNKLIQEIERLREEVTALRFRIGMDREVIQELQDQKPLCCKSCGYLDKDKKFFQRLRANQKQLFYCTMNKTYWPLNGFCHNHPDWKEPGKG